MPAPPATVSGQLVVRLAGNVARLGPDADSGAKSTVCSEVARLQSAVPALPQVTPPSVAVAAAVDVSTPRTNQYHGPPACSRASRWSVSSQLPGSGASASRVPSYVEFMNGVI